MTQQDPTYTGGWQQPPPPAPGFHGVPPVGHGPPGGYSDRSKVAAGLLQLLLSLVGIPGIGRLYAGHVALGLVQLVGMFLGYALLIFLVGFLIVPAIWIWSVVDGIVMLAGDPVDGDGRRLRP